MIPVFFNGWKLGPAECTIPYPQCRLLEGLKFRRESRRSSVQMRRDGLTAAPWKQPVSYKYNARLQWHSVQTRCQSTRLLYPAGWFVCRQKNVTGNRTTAASNGFIFTPLSSLPSRVYITVREADGQSYLLFSNRWLKRTNKDMSAKMVLWAAKVSQKKALSPPSCGRLTGEGWLEFRGSQTKY